jgi:hypothetical protein
VFATDCFLGNDYVFHVEVWSHEEDGQPVQLPAVVAFTKWEGVIDSHDVEDGTLIIQTSEPAPGDDTPHLNGYPFLVTTAWSFDGDAWIAEERSRVDTTPEPEPQPEPTAEQRAPKPEPKPDPQPSPGACEQLGFEGMSDDDEYCAEVLAGMEECERRMEADPDWFYSDDSGGWENIHTGEWQPPCDI